MEVPKKGDLDVKAAWLHQKLTRAVVVGGDNVSADDAKRGVEKYFAEELKEIAACRIQVHQQDFGAAHLAGLLQDSNAVVLLMSMEYSNGGNFAVSSVLESITEEGKFVIHLFERRFSGSLKPLDEKQKGPPGAVPSEYVLDRPRDLPEYYAQNEAKFFMSVKTWNAAILQKPYVYLTPGKPSPLPAGE